MGRRLSGAIIALLTVALFTVAAAREDPLTSSAQSASDADSAELATDFGDLEDLSKSLTLKTEEQAKRALAAYATDDNQLMFTTNWNRRQNFSKDGFEKVLHVWESLRAVGRIQNAVMITYELEACQVLWAKGIVCFVDRFQLQPEDLPGSYTFEVPNYYQKHKWAQQLNQWNFTAIFFETDQVFLKDPLPYLNGDADIQGLSDWRTLSIPTAKERWEQPCSLYHWQKYNDGEVALEMGMYSAQVLGNLPTQVPCMSTGFWVLRPTSHTKNFSDHMLSAMTVRRTYQNEQILFNEIISLHFIGQRGQRGLSFMLLDETNFANLEVYDGRKNAGLQMDPVMLHMGYINGVDKSVAMKKHNLWKADQWDHEMAIQNLHRNHVRPKRSHM